MRHESTLTELAIKLRKKGRSFAEISSQLNIAKSTASLWTRQIELSKKAKSRIEQRRIIGRLNANKTKTKKATLKVKQNTAWANQLVNEIKITPKLAQIFGALLYWAEGAKFTVNRLEFTNSDPTMIRTFLSLLRKGFDINESKLRANVHLHEYHDEQKQLNFWSSITNIPISNFYKSYLKPNTQTIIRKNYPGCVRIIYYSGDTAQKIKSLYTILVKILI